MHLIIAHLTPPYCLQIPCGHCTPALATSTLYSMVKHNLSRPAKISTICGGLSLGKALIIRYRLAVWLFLGAASGSARACGLLCTTQKSHAAGRPHSQLPFCFCFCSLRIALPCPALLAIVPESSPPPSSPLKKKRVEKKQRSDEQTD
jgi:hypothetical protein